MRILINALLVITAGTFTVAACGDEKTTTPPVDTAQADTAPDVAVNDVGPEDVAVEEVALEDAIVADTTAEDVAAEVITPPPICEVAPIPVLGAQHTSNTALCLSCVNTSCCAEMTACGDNAACLTVRNCFAGCGSDDDECFTACADANEGFLATNAPFITCRTDNCGYQCALDTCVGQVVWPEPTVASRTIVNTFLDFQSREPIAALNLKVCAKTDAACESPLSEGTTDAEGKITLDLPTAVGGLSVFLVATGEGYMPTDFWFVHQSPETFLDVGGLSFLVVSDATASLLAGFVGATFDPTRGSMSYVAIGCDGTALAGLAVSADTEDAATVHLYMTSAIPSVAVTATHKSGTGALLNLPVGPATLTGTGLDGRVWSQHTVNIRAGHMIATNMPVTPVPAAAAQ